MPSDCQLSGFGNRHGLPLRWVSSAPSGLTEAMARSLRGAVSHGHGRIGEHMCIAQAPATLGMPHSGCALMVLHAEA